MQIPLQWGKRREKQEPRELKQKRSKRKERCAFCKQKASDIASEEAMLKNKKGREAVVSFP
jgi:hypothetical protein